MAILTFDEIMAAEDITTDEVKVKEWGGEVLCRSISHRTMRQIKKRVKEELESDDDDAANDEIEKWVFIEGMIEPKVGPEEYEMLLDKSTAAMNKVLIAIMGRSKAEEKSEKDAEKSVPSGAE